MKFRFLILIALIAVMAQPVLSQQAEKPLTKNQIMDLVKAGMDNTQLAKMVRERGIDFEPTDDDLQALRKAGGQDVLITALHAAKPQPLTQDQMLHLVAGGLPSERVTVLVKQRGIDFLAEEDYLDTLRLAGADDTLIAAVREASTAATAALAVDTSPSAEVFLDGESQGHANAQGELNMKPKLGDHALKISLAGKIDFERSFTLTGRQALKIDARLVDAPGSIRVRTLAGASISLDGANRGRADASGELVLTDVAPGPHELRVSAEGKKDYWQSATVAAGQENRIETTLADIEPPHPRVETLRENPHDRAQGSRFEVTQVGNALFSSIYQGHLTIGNGRIKYDARQLVTGMGRTKKDTDAEVNIFDLPVGSVHRTAKGVWYGAPTVEIWLEKGKKYTFAATNAQAVIDAIQAAAAGK